MCRSVAPGRKPCNTLYQQQRCTSAPITKLYRHKNLTSGFMMACTKARTIYWMTGGTGIGCSAEAAWAATGAATSSSVTGATAGGSGDCRLDASTGNALRVQAGLDSGAADAMRLQARKQESVHTQS